MTSNPPPIVIFGLSGAVLWLVATGSDPLPAPPTDVRLPAAVNAVIPSPQPTCQRLTSLEVRRMVQPFEPPPGYSYPVGEILTPYCRQISDHVRANGSKVNRFLYESHDGLRLATLVENDRVIGLQLFPEE